MPSAAIFGAGGGIGGALVEALATSGRYDPVYAASRVPLDATSGVIPLACDGTAEDTVAAAIAAMVGEPPELTIVASGALTFADGTGPERSLRAIDPARMAQMFALNTIAPATIAKHVLPRLPRDRRTVFALLSARVGSIGDNRLGGWHSYRASKAALNMLVRNFALEMARTHPHAVIVALHPGTVDTGLSRPFQRNLPEGQVVPAAQCAANLLRVLDGLTARDSGGFFAWDGQPIPW